MRLVWRLRFAGKNEKICFAIIFCRMLFIFILKQAWWIFLPDIFTHKNTKRSKARFSNSISAQHKQTKVVDSFVQQTIRPKFVYLIHPNCSEVKTTTELQCKYLRMKQDNNKNFQQGRESARRSDKEQQSTILFAIKLIEIFLFRFLPGKICC